MNLFHYFPPRKEVSESDVKFGMNMLIFDGICSQVMGSLTTGAFLAAFAVLLGASNFVIGLLAAVSPLSQMLQIPAIYLVNHFGTRRGLVVLSSLVSRLFWFVIAAIPFFLPGFLQIPALLLLLFAFFALGAISGCSWNSWVRDFIPDKIRGSYFGNRQSIAVAVGAALSIVAALYVDAQKAHGETGVLKAYASLFITGGSFGLLGCLFLWLTPEPAMEKSDNLRFLEIIRGPLHDREYRKLVVFLATLSFAMNLGAPFFTVYMIQRLEMGISWIIGLAVLSQVFNIIFFRVWGKAADNFGNKPILYISSTLFMLCFLIWPFTGMPQKHALTIPLLIVIHIFSGISTAGITLCTGTISAKMAPRGKATAFLATNAFISGIAATLGPILGGILADVFNRYDLSLTATFTAVSNPENPLFRLQAFNLYGLDFLFVLAFIFGLYSIHRLLSVSEDGEVEKGIVIQHYLNQSRRSARAIGNIAGMRAMSAFPYQLLQKKRKARKNPAKLNNPDAGGN